MLRRPPKTPTRARFKAMADNKKQRGAQDRSRASGMQDYEVKYLAQKHGVTQKTVKDAVAKVGNSRARIEAELKRSR